MKKLTTYLIMEGFAYSDEIYPLLGGNCLKRDTKIDSVLSKAISIYCNILINSYPKVRNTILYSITNNIGYNYNVKGKRKLLTLAK